MKASISSFERSNQPAHSSPPFRCVIIYEDTSAGKVGETIYQYLLRSIGEDCVATRHLWSFAVLGSREIRNIAATTAAVADLVIFALSGKEELPPTVRQWIEMWLWLIDGRKPAVVPVFDPANSRSTALVSYLCSVAARKRLECFPHSGSFPAAVSPATPDSATLPSHLHSDAWDESELRLCVLS